MDFEFENNFLIFNVVIRSYDYGLLLSITMIYRKRNGAVIKLFPFFSRSKNQRAVAAQEKRSLSLSRSLAFAERVKRKRELPAMPEVERVGQPEAAAAVTEIGIDSGRRDGRRHHDHALDPRGPAGSSLFGQGTVSVCADAFS